MKIVKLLVGIIVIAFFGLVFYQNWDFFRDKQSLDINLFFTEYQSPALPIALMMAFMFLFGWLVAYLSGLADRFGFSSRNKRLQQTIHMQQTAIDAMKKDVEALKPKPATGLTSSPPEAASAASTYTDEVSAESPQPIPPETP